VEGWGRHWDTLLMVKKFNQSCVKRDGRGRHKRLNQGKKNLAERRHVHPGIQRSVGNERSCACGVKMPLPELNSSSSYVPLAGVKKEVEQVTQRGPAGNQKAQKVDPTMAKGGGPSLQHSTHKHCRLRSRGKEVTKSARTGGKEGPGRG